VPAPRIGCHLSLGTKPDVSLADAAAHGVECVQIFASSPAAWKAPVEDAARDALVVNALEVNDLHPLFIHAIYLVNLASPDRTLVRRSRISLIATLEAVTRLRAAGVIAHVGSHMGRGFETVAGRAAAGILHVLDLAPERIDLILENSAGAGGLIGSTLEELAELLDRAKRHPAVKIALDTAHLCGAGWDFKQEETAPLLVERVRATVGLDRLVAIHANDSKVPPGSRRDRHSSVGEGYIGVEGFRYLLAQPALRTIPWICETPDLGSVDTAQRFGSVELLRELAVSSAIDAPDPVP
jgi:deoxyribonuclease IV